MTRRVLLAVLAVAAVIASASPAQAEVVSAGAVTGTGAYSPGLTSTPTAQSVTFEGTLTFSFVSHGLPWAGRLPCSWSGSSTGTETVTVGQGVLGGQCWDSAANVAVHSCQLSYVRTVAVLSATGPCQLFFAGRQESIVLAVSLAVQNGAGNPVTTYSATGAVALEALNSSAGVGGGTAIAYPSGTYMAFGATVVVSVGDVTEQANLSCGAEVGDPGWGCGGTTASGLSVSYFCNGAVDFLGEISGVCDVSVGGRYTRTLTVWEFVAVPTNPVLCCSPRYYQLLLVQRPGL